MQEKRAVNDIKRAICPIDERIGYVKLNMRLATTRAVPPREIDGRLAAIPAMHFGRHSRSLKSLCDLLRDIATSAGHQARHQSGQLR